MTGFRSSHMRHSCPLNGCYYDTLPEWDYLLSAFPRKIRPTDIDGMVEVNRHFLFLEQKGEGTPFDGGKSGQWTAFGRLAEQPRTTVVFFRPNGSALDVLVRGREPWRTYTKPEFVAWLRNWAADAEQGRAAA